ncbi:MAG: hypothetical protein RRA92_05475 [Gemmatimonadota bacterium]|nr:hypothetical protein [Gemmatimonadota bacterium]
MSDIVIAAATGLAAGLHSATWGMFKDAPHEGFTWRTYARSPLLATIVAVALVAGGAVDPGGAAGLVVLFAVTYGIERALIEVYKTFLREEDQSKYTIPMQLSIRGRVIESRRVRLTAGAFYFAGELAILFGALRLQSVAPDPALLPAALFGSIGGWVSAFGGAWKDAPIEGFSLPKFFRSPLIAFAYGFLLAHFTRNYALLLLGSIGLTVATTETYKTFFFPNKNRGKFMGREPGYPRMLNMRWRFVPLYVAIWLGVITAAAVALGT